MIEARHINKKFGKLEALQDVNVTCQQGQCIAMIGPNGCGKTTLIKSILGMVLPDSGDIFFNDTSIRNDYLYRQHIGYMPQIGKYPENMTIGQVITMIEKIREHQSSSLDRDLAHQYNIDKFLAKKMSTLSGGTTQKVSAILAFLFNPKVLILDEPTAGLDPISSEILKEKIIAEKQKGKLILITSHLLSELDQLATQLIYMQDGKVIFHKDISTLQHETGEEKISKAITHFLKHKEN